MLSENQGIPWLLTHSIPLRFEAPVVGLPQALVGHGPQLRVHYFADLLPVPLAASFPQDVVFRNEVVVFAFL